MESKIKTYVTSILLVVFSWFFLVQPLFALTAHPQSDKIKYYQASSEDAFDAGIYFEISKEDTDADEVDFGHGQKFTDYAGCFFSTILSNSTFTNLSFNLQSLQPFFAKTIQFILIL